MKSAVAAVARTSRVRAAPATFRFFGSIDDVKVTVNFIDYQGQTHTVPGRIGMALTDVADMHGLQDILHDDASSSTGGDVFERVHSDQWTEDLFGEGPVSNLSHVVVPPEWMAKLPTPTSKEVALIEKLSDEVVTENSRLGAEIVLTKELDGITVWCPDSPPWEIP